MMVPLAPFHPDDSDAQEDTDISTSTSRDQRLGHHRTTGMLSGEAHAAQALQVLL